MNQIEYLNLDLFIYNITEGLPRNQNGIPNTYENYWLNTLEAELTSKNLSTEITLNKPKWRTFKNTITASIPVTGRYIWEKLYDDSDCLWFSCAIKQKIELIDVASKVDELKNYLILPQINPNIQPFPSYFGQTWIVSGWGFPNNPIPDQENLAGQIYKQLIRKEHQYQEIGNFLGTTILEMWRGSEKWEGIEQDSYVLIILYPDEAACSDGARYYNSWRDLFCCRNKIIWAYEQGKKLKQSLLKEYKKTVIGNTSLPDLSQKDLPELKNELQKNIERMSNYVQNINLLATQQHTVEVNLTNYKKLLNAYFSNNKLLENFSNVVEKTYKAQLEKDYLSLNPGLAVLENITTTIRGMVELEQAQRDRNLNNTVAIAGVGLATSQIASSIIIAQEPPPQDLPFFQTTAFWWSLATGLIASLILWSILRLYRLITRFCR